MTMSATAAGAKVKIAAVPTSKAESAVESRRFMVRASRLRGIVVMDLRVSSHR